MGDISELRGLIVLFTITAVTITLILLIPPAFYTATEENPSGPTNFDPEGLVAWNETTNVNMTDGTAYTVVINGYNVGIDPTLGFLRFFTYAHWGPFYWDYDYFSWYVDGVDITGANYRVAYSTIDTYTLPLKVELKNSKTEMKVTLSYNTTGYASFESAIETGTDEAYATFNVDWDDRNTSMNALQLIGMVLTGSLPNVHPYLSVVFGFIGWGIIAAASYLAFIFVLRIIGAVFGGGGA